MVKKHDIIYGPARAAAARRRLVYGLAPPTDRYGPPRPKGKEGYIKAREEKQILQSMKNISVDSDRIWYNITTKDFHMNSFSNKLGISRKGDNERRGGTSGTGEASGTGGTGTSGTGEASGTGGTGTSGTGARHARHSGFACHARPARPASHHHSAERINQ